MLRVVIATLLLLPAFFVKANAGSSLEEPVFSSKDPRAWVVMVTQPGCSFCVRLETEILQPLRASNLFKEKVRFTAVDIGAAIPMTDFDGTRTTTIEFANRYPGFRTPTLLLLDSDGEVLAEPKFGVPDIIDFYAYEIEETIRSLPAVN